MSRLWPGGEPIRLVLNEAGAPGQFVWQGRIHRMERVHQRWQVDTDWWSDEGRVWRDYLAATTTDGLLCVLYFDWLDRCWYLARIYD